MAKHGRGETEREDQEPFHFALSCPIYNPLYENLDVLGRLTNRYKPQLGFLLRCGAGQISQRQTVT